ncbi:DivIVA domain-containing protein [bacterium]|nr:DivIVA domain-containing protein [bacterium]
MRLTPLDIQQHSFKKKGERYEAAEVDSYLDLVRQDYEETLRIIEGQKDQIRKLEAQLSEMHANERVLKDAIISAQKMVEDMKANAKKEAEIVVAEARLDAERIVDNARHEVERVQYDIAELKRQRVQFETELHALIRAHDNLLEATSARMKEKDGEAAKLKVFPKKA